MPHLDESVRRSIEHRRETIRQSLSFFRSQRLHLAGLTVDLNILPTDVPGNVRALIVRAHFRRARLRFLRRERLPGGEVLPRDDGDGRRGDDCSNNCEKRPTTKWFRGIALA